MKFKIRRVPINDFEFCKIYPVKLTSNAQILNIDIWNGGVDLIVMEGYTDPIEHCIRQFLLMSEGCQIEIPDIVETPRLVKRNTIQCGVDRYYLLELL